MDMGIVVIARPSSSVDLRDSGRSEQDADVVIFLWPVSEFAGYRIQGAKPAKPEFGPRFEGAMQRWGESKASITPPASSRFCASSQGLRFICRLTKKSVTHPTLWNRT